MNPKPETVIAIYRVQPAEETAFFEVLRRHHPTLRSLGLVTETEPIVYRGQEQDGGPIVFEIFTWIDGDAPNKAHQLPEVMQIWEPLGALCEERAGKPKFEFPHVEQVDLASVGA